jgi:hypothetical protein
VCPYQSRCQIIKLHSFACVVGIQFHKHIVNIQVVLHEIKERSRPARVCEGNHELGASLGSEENLTLINCS